MLQVFWAHILCLDPVSGEPLPVPADHLVSLPGEYTHALSPPDPNGTAEPSAVAPQAAPHMHGGHAYSQQHSGGEAPPADVRASQSDLHRQRSGGGSDIERTALCLNHYSSLVHVTMHDGLSPPDAPAASAHAEADARPAWPSSPYPAYPGLPGPVSTRRILDDANSQIALQAAVRDQSQQLRVFKSAAPALTSEASPPDPPDVGGPGSGLAPDGQHELTAAMQAAQAALYMPPGHDTTAAPEASAREHVPAAHAAHGGAGGGHGEAAAAAARTGDGGSQAAWRSRVEQCCRVAAAQSSGAAGPADLNAGVKLQMRIAMELCDLGACRACGVCSVLRRPRAACCVNLKSPRVPVCTTNHSKQHSNCVAATLACCVPGKHYER